MSHNHRKRKHKPTGSAGYRNYPVVEASEPEQFLAHHQGYQPQPQSQTQSWAAPDTSNTVDPLRALYIQAHEADIIHGDAARAAAESLEVVEYRTVLTASGTREISVLPRIGSALIQWGDSTSGTRTKSKVVILPTKANVVGVDFVGDEEDEDKSDIGETGTSLTPSESCTLFRRPLALNFGSAKTVLCARFLLDESRLSMPYRMHTSKHAITPIAKSTRTKRPRREPSRKSRYSPPRSVQHRISSFFLRRYDARLLLNALPSDPPSIPNSRANPNVTTSTPSQRPPIHRPASPSGWSDIASDAEDTFFFTPDEVEDYHREKRRRLLEQSREERLRARMQEDGVNGNAEEEDIWGGSDEEPDETQNGLMTRTATHLLSSPNPAQLEMRILANHGGDRRFAFLRGRWKNAWNLAKAKARLKKQEEEKPEKPVALSSALAGYGSGSDSEDEPEEPPEPLEDVPPAPAKTEEVSAQELRRQRLKKWTEERRALQQQGSSK
ncbi:hypothetical protein D9619_008695 [Psilocybe cf. subviscida]|uniref:Uncharacterized protein n=1 Tax=Psilocybe cf. subviscida TaxID=2480587 RepID=A0A8H5BAJ5_9AGAR|nr:hypothetical protein D9619_008695 [Psilocybe cf. subviscida]